jgi:RNA polymerase sigma-70 factor, ECF subfamily
VAELLEQRLMKAGRGDIEAAAAVYDDVAEVVYGLTLHMVGDPERAEGLARDALLAVLSAAHHFDPARGSARSWIVAITHQLAVRSQRPAPTTRRRAREAPMPAAGLTTLSGPDALAVELAYFGLS